MQTRSWAGGSGPREVSGAKHDCSGSPLSGPPFPHLRTRVAAESFGVKCILGGTPLGTLGSGDLGTPGDGQQVLPSHKGSCVGSGDKVVFSTQWESLGLIRSTDFHPCLPGASVSWAEGGA